MQMNWQIFANMAMLEKFGKLWVGCGCAMCYFPAMVFLHVVTCGHSRRCLCSYSFMCLPAYPFSKFHFIWVYLYMTLGYDGNLTKRKKLFRMI